MASFLKEYPQFSEYYYWNVLTIEKRTVMLSDAARVEYKNLKKKNSVDGSGENVTVVSSIEDL